MRPKIAHAPRNTHHEKIETKRMNNKQLTNPRGLIFDCDGTLADTMPLHWRAWQIITQRHGLHFPQDRFYALGGVPSRDILKMLAEEQGRSINYIAVGHEKEEAYLPLMAEVEPIHAVVEIAKANHGKIPMAVASGGTEKIIGMVLKKIGVRHLFDAIVTSEMVKNQKPAPDIFLEAARRIGVDPKFCRGYEDTDLGMTAIRSAGMEAVDVRRLLKDGVK
jgi:beta-phosphoglucomutase family hydrolase